VTLLFLDYVEMENLTPVKRVKIVQKMLEARVSFVETIFVNPVNPM
jgi:hypothetical protein